MPVLDAFLCRPQTEMMLAGPPRFAAVGVLVGRLTYQSGRSSIRSAARVPSSEKRLRDAVARFWMAVDSGVPPQIDFERDGPLLALLYPHETPGKIVVGRRTGDDRIGRTCSGWRQDIKDQIGTAQNSNSASTMRIKAKLEDGEAAIIPGWRLTPKQIMRRKEYAVKAIMAIACCAIAGRIAWT